jgi:hypothetical protein
VRPLSSERPTGREFDALAQLEGVVVGDDDFGAGLRSSSRSPGTNSRSLVIAIRVVGLETTRRRSLMVMPGVHDEKAAGEMFAAGAADGVDGLPGDEHGHDGGFARAGGQLQRDAQQFGIGVLVGVRQVIEQFACRSPLVGATSVSQMAVSMASTWQKNGFMLANLYCRQCWSRRAVSGVTCHWLGLGKARH